MGRSKVAANPVPGSSRSSRSWPASGIPGSRPAPSSSGQPFKQCFGSGSSRSWPASGIPGSRPALSSSGQPFNTVFRIRIRIQQILASQWRSRLKTGAKLLRSAIHKKPVFRIRIQQILASQWHSRLKTGAKLLRSAVHKNGVSDPDPDPADSGQPVALQTQDQRQAP
jgi:hypothetical protein